MTSAQAKIGGERAGISHDSAGRAERHCGLSDLGAATALILGAPGCDPSKRCKSLQWGHGACLHQGT